MKKFAYLFTSICMALCFSACDELDENEDGDSCENPGYQYCQKGMLMACETISPGSFINRWHSKACDPGSYCRTYKEKSGCFEQCTAAEVGNRNPNDNRQICTQIGSEYFYTY